MSWTTLNTILAIALTDPEFAAALLHNATQTLKERGFELTIEEQRTFASCKATTLAELSQHLLQTIRL